MSNDHIANPLQPLEQVIVSHFIEVKRHKPSVIYIPAIDGWWEAMSGAAITTFKTMLRTIPPTDPILLLGTSETEVLDLDSALLRDLFGFSKKNRAMIERPNKVSTECTHIHHVRAWLTFHRMCE
jgi:SpoVK/Ycf46/Vps4 family AAA+-type ATPase